MTEWGYQRSLFFSEARAVGESASLGSMPNERIEITRGDVVVDTNVLVDLLFSDRPGHADAKQLSQRLAETGVNVFVPAHAFFEIFGVGAQAHRAGQRLTLVGSKSNLWPFKHVIVSIDLDFVHEYLIEPLSRGVLLDTRGAVDTIAAAIAHKHQLTLITEDRRLTTGAARSGVQTQTVNEYLAVPPT